MKKWEYKAVYVDITKTGCDAAYIERKVVTGRIEYLKQWLRQRGEKSNTTGSYKQMLDSLGQQGWELVNVTRKDYFIFKRPKQ